MTMMSNRLILSVIRHNANFIMRKSVLHFSSGNLDCFCQLEDVLPFMRKASALSVLAKSV